MNLYITRRIKLDESDHLCLLSIARQLAYERNGVSAVLRAIIRQWASHLDPASRPRVGFPVLVKPVYHTVKFTPETFAILESLVETRRYGPHGISGAARVIIREWQLAQSGDTAAFYVSLSDS